MKCKLCDKETKDIIMSMCFDCWQAIDCCGLEKL